MTIAKYITLILFSAFLLAQDGAILPGQKSAIQSLSTAAGFTSADLNTYLVQNYGQTLDGLSRTQGASAIKAFQTGSASKPVAAQQKEDLAVASILEVGMKKRFHFRDGSVRDGEIVSIEDGTVAIKTGSGTFNIPADQFLSETAEVKNKKGELFKGVVLGETAEEYIIRTSFGDAVVQKKDIQSMKRYHGGILDRQSEERRKFYQSEAQLLSVFMDPTAFPLTGNTFYASGLSIGYGLTDRFMITTKFGSDFNNDLNLHPRMRFYHRKSAEKEMAAAWGLGIHRKYPSKSVIGKYSHAINIKSNGKTTPLNEMDTLNIDAVALEDDGRRLYAEAFLVFSSRRVNPTGRGKIGWTLGTKVSNAFVGRDKIIKKVTAGGDSISWSAEGKYSVPFRTWLSLEYDLRKDLKFVGSAWVDNGYKTMAFGDTFEDYTDNFSLDSPGGEVSMIDFDFGILYAVNESFRVGLHFQQPYIDFYWEFFEF
ncbi:uncharacterized protein METZ01_LOCUS148391 [marine metagenome]|uniref:Uncharacterized protein n=1 Tax=marine metagenome TaxID=408172 RepID=A0A382A383_9ZZZZ